MNDVLVQNSWYRAGADPGSASVARYTFRGDGQGRYEPEISREGTPHERVERSRSQDFRWEMRGETLRIKFARARDGFETPAHIEPGPRRHSDAARFARWVLVLARDPYAFVIAGQIEADSRWESDAGGSLPG